MSNFINLVEDYINIQSQKNALIGKVLETFEFNLIDAASDPDSVSDYALMQLMSSKQAKLVKEIVGERIKAFEKECKTIDFSQPNGALDNDLLNATHEIASIDRDFEDALVMYDGLFTHLNTLHDTVLVHAAQRLQSLKSEQYVESDPLLEAIKDEYSNRKSAREKMESLSLA